MKAEKRCATCARARRILRFGQSAFTKRFPEGDGVAQVLGRQRLRSGTSVAAHYREACRAKSNLDFINKLEGGLQELDETDLWLELLGDAGTIKSSRIKPLRNEVDELIAIFVTMIRKVKRR